MADGPEVVGRAVVDVVADLESFDRTLATELPRIAVLRAEYAANLARLEISKGLEFDPKLGGTGRWRLHGRIISSEIAKGIREEEKKIQDELLRIGRDIKGMEMRSGPTRVASGVTAGARQTGKEAADELIKGFRAELHEDLAYIKRDFHRGVIDEAAMHRAGREARRRFNQGLMSGADRLDRDGILKNEDRVRIFNALEDAGMQAGRKFGDAVERSPTQNFRRMTGFLKGLFMIEILGIITGFAGRVLDVYRRIAEGFVNLVVRGTKVQRLEDNFEALTARVGANADEMLAGMRRASRGLATDTELMTRANFAIQARLPLTTESMERLVLVSRRLAEAQGRDVPEAFQRMVNGIAKKERRVLDELGLIVNATEANRRYAQQHNKSVDDLSEHEKVLAFFNATMEQAEQKMRTMGEETEGAGITFEFLKTQMTNVIDQTATLVAQSPTLSRMLGGISTDTDRAADSVANLAANFAAFIETMLQIGEQAKDSWWMKALGWEARVGARMMGMGDVGGMFRQNLEDIRARQQQEHLDTQLRSENDLNTARARRLFITGQIEALDRKMNGRSIGPNDPDNELRNEYIRQRRIVDRRINQLENPEEPDKPLIDPPTQSQLNKIENARRQLAALRQELEILSQFQNREGRPFRTWDEVPERLRSVLQDVRRIDREIAQTQKQMDDANQQDPVLLRAIEGWKAQRVTLMEQARAISQTDEGQLTTAQLQSKKRIEDLRAGFAGLIAAGATFKEEVPDAFLQAFDDAAQLTNQIKEVQRLMWEAPPESQVQGEEVIRFLEAQRERSAQLANTLLPVRNIMQDLPSLGAELLREMPQSAWAGVVDVFRDLHEQLKDVRDAQIELRAAEIANDPEREARARRALTLAQRAAANGMQDYESRLRAAGLEGRMLLVVLEAIRAELDKQGVEVARASTNWERWQKTADVFVEIVGGLRQIGEQLGVVDEQTAQLLQGFEELGTGISRIIASGGADIGGWIQAIGGAIDVGKGLLGGETAAQKEFERTQRERFYDLIAALDRLRNTILDDVSSKQIREDITAVEKMLGAATAEYMKSKGDYDRNKRSDSLRRQDMADIAVAMGLTDRQRAGETQGDAKTRQVEALQAYLAELDARYGTNFSAFMENNDVAGLMEALREALPQLREELEQLGMFGDDVAGIINRVNFEFQALGKTNVGERIRAIVSELRKAGKSFGDFEDEVSELVNLDLSTDEGKARLNEIIQSMLTDLANGADLGDMTADQIREFILQWQQALEGGATDAGSTRGFQVNRSITEVTAMRMIGYLATANYLSERQLRALEVIAGAITGQPYELTPPQYTQPVLLPSGPSYSIDFAEGSIQVTVSMPFIETLNPTETGAMIGRSVADNIDEKLNRRLQELRRANGYTTIEG